MWIMYSKVTVNWIIYVLKGNCHVDYVLKGNCHVEEVFTLYGLCTKGKYDMDYLGTCSNCSDCINRNYL